MPCSAQCTYDWLQLGRAILESLLSLASCRLKAVQRRHEPVPTDRQIAKVCVVLPPESLGSCLPGGTLL